MIKYFWSTFAHIVCVAYIRSEYFIHNLLRQKYLQMENIDACVCMRKGNKTKKKKKRREDTFASFTVVRMVWRRWMWRAYRKYGARKINSFYASVARDWCVARNIILSDSWFVYTIYALLTQPDSTQALQIIPFYLNTNDCWPNRTSMCDER